MTDRVVDDLLHLLCAIARNSRKHLSSFLLSVTYNTLVILYERRVADLDCHEIDLPYHAAPAGQEEFGSPGISAPAART
jgi:hypothetical protein